MSATTWMKVQQADLNDIYKSTIHNDYRCLDSFTKQYRMPSPDPAHIFSLDARINEQMSLTASHYNHKSLVEQVKLSNVATLGLGTKNLTKMDFGKEGMIRSNTSHREYFPVNVIEMVIPKDDMMKSCISQGDKEKVSLPLTHYKENFQANEKREMKLVTSPRHHDTSRLLRGDPRCYTNQFQTTSSKTFDGKFSGFERREPIKNNRCDVMLNVSDDNQTMYTVTTNHKFFKEKPLIKVHPCGPNYRSNIVFGDDVSEWSLSGFQKEGRLPQVGTQHLVSRQAKLNMCKSSIPRDDPQNERERITQTTSRTYYGKPCVLDRYAKVDGAFLLTKSKIRFGSERSGSEDRNYATTMVSNYPVNYLPVNRRCGQMTKSDVCLSYYADQMRQSTTVEDFPPHLNVKRLVSNPECVTNLKASHIVFPISLA